MLCAPLVQAGSDIVLLLSSDALPYREVEQGIRATLFEQNNEVEISSLTLDALLKGETALPADHRVLVAIGTRATRHALQENISNTVYASFITASGLLREIASEKGFPDALQGAVVLDQPAERIVQLAKLINPKARRLGTVVNGSAPNRLDEFKRVVKGQGLELMAASLFEESNPIADLKNIFARSDVFLVIPDKARFNSKIAKWVLFLSYRHRVPVIGYSKKYTDAGALISIFSTPWQVGRDTGERLLGYFSAQAQRPPVVHLQYPRYFSLSVNDKVAESLGLKIGDEAQLKERMRKQQGARIKDGAGLVLDIVEQ
jgi:ABC-type uncharacterized transport system substrate-binding protein